MHIKEVRLRNFLSYADCRVEFSKGINAIYGLNGSGKSNVLKAIEYVLSHSYLRPASSVNLYRDVAYVSNNKGSARPSGAEVSVVVDNTDRRIPAIDKDVVVFRREFRVHSDDFYLEGKKLSKKDMEEYLDVAGLTGKNPYFIVQQGMITQMADATPVGRCKVVKELAGFTYYDEKRKILMNDLSAIEADEINFSEMMTSAEQHLTKFEKANADYVEFKRLQRELTACTYGLETAKCQVMRFNEAKESEKIEKLSTTVEEKEKERSAIEGQLCIFKERLEGRKTEAANEKTRLDKNKEEREGLVSEMAKEEIKLAGLEKEAEELKGKKTNEGAIKKAEQKLNKLEEERTKISSQLSTMRESEAEAEARVTDLKSRHEALLNRQALANQFAGNASQRDAFLRQKIKELKSISTDSRNQISVTASGIAEAKSILNQKKIEYEEVFVDKVACQETLQNYSKKQDSFKEKFDAKRSELNSLVKEVERRESEMDSAKSELNKIELASFMPRSVKRGFESMQQIINALKEEDERKKKRGSGDDDKNEQFDAAGLLEGYYGMLVEHIDPRDDSFATAIQVIAGAKLWYFVVDDSHFATEFLKRQSKQGLSGEINFIAIDEILSNPEKKAIVTQEWIARKVPQYKNEAKPALDLVNSNTRGVQPALDFVFGQDLVCGGSKTHSAFDVACEVRTQTRRQCVTLDGEKVEKKGAMTGGFFDSRRTKLGSWKLYQNRLSNLDAAKEAWKEAATKLVTANEETAALAAKFNKSKDALDHQRRRHEHLFSTASLLKRQVESSDLALKANEESLRKAEEFVAEVEKKLKTYELELAKDVTMEGDGASALTPEEEAALVQMAKDIATLEGPLPKREGPPELARLRTQSLKLEKVFNDKSLDYVALNRELAALKEDALNREEKDESLRRISAEIGASKRGVDENGKRLKDLEKIIAETMKVLDGFEADLPDLKEELVALEKLEADASSASKDSVERRDAAKKKRDEIAEAVKQAEKDIVNMSLDLRPEEKQKYIAASSSSATAKSSVSKLEKTMADLKAKKNDLNFEPVKVTKFGELETEKKALLKDKSRSEKNKERLHTLLESLENVKREAIEETIERITKHFKEIFTALVPGGNADLIPTAYGDANNNSNRNNANGNTASDDGADTRSEISTASSSVSSSQLRWGHHRLDDYGLDIHATFNNSSVAMKSISSLSGGQKSLLAIAFIFALQRVDPAPFYIFDEADAHVDEHYKQRLVNLMRTHSTGANGAQFILTAHKKQMIEGADRIFRVEMVNNQSRIHESDVAEATKYFAKKPIDEEESNEDASEASGAGSGAGTPAGNMAPPAVGAPKRAARKRPASSVSPSSSSGSPSSDG